MILFFLQQFKSTVCLICNNWNLQTKWRALRHFEEKLWSEYSILFCNVNEKLTTSLLDMGRKLAYQIQQNAQYQCMHGTCTYVKRKRPFQHQNHFDAPFSDMKKKTVPCLQCGCTILCRRLARYIMQFCKNNSKKKQAVFFSVGSVEPNRGILLVV